MAFAGFDREAMQFFHELTLEMNRDWFAANKDRYERLWVEPMTALFEEVRERVGRTYAPIKVGEPKLFRIHRDVRFAKDKTPYKTHCAGHIPLHTAKKPVEGGATALYLEIGVEGDYAGAGTYFFDDKQLARWRKLVAADRTSGDVTKLVGKLRKAGYEVGGHEDLKRVPKPYAADHPRGDLLKMRGLTVAFPAIPKGLVHKPAFAGWLADHVKAAAPLVRWIYTNLK